MESREREISERTSTLKVCIRGLPETTTLITMHMEASTPTISLG